MKRMNFITIMLLISSFGSCQSELTEFPAQCTLILPQAFNTL